MWSEGDPTENAKSFLSSESIKSLSENTFINSNLIKAISAASIHNLVKSEEEDSRRGIAERQISNVIETALEISRSMKADPSDLHDLMEEVSRIVIGGERVGAFDIEGTDEEETGSTLKLPGLFRYNLI